MPAHRLLANAEDQSVAGQPAYLEELAKPEVDQDPVMPMPAIQGRAFAGTELRAVVPISI
jgi:hypothetical protein